MRDVYYSDGGINMTIMVIDYEDKLRVNNL